jgi:hypothetical protein
LFKKKKERGRKHGREIKEGEFKKKRIGRASMTMRSLPVRGLCVFLTPFRCSQRLFLE